MNLKNWLFAIEQSFKVFKNSIYKQLFHASQKLII